MVRFVRMNQEALPAVNGKSLLSVKKRYRPLKNIPDFFAFMRIVGISPTTGL
jgi:hypothetical protein